jgi:hypothetical protein
MGAAQSLAIHRDRLASPLLVTRRGRDLDLRSQASVPPGGEGCVQRRGVDDLEHAAHRCFVR